MGLDTPTPNREDAIYSQCDPTDAERVSHRVVRCVARATDTSPTELPPIYDVIDTDALDALFPPTGAGNCWIKFRYAGTVITVCEKGDIWVIPPDGLD